MILNAYAVLDGFLTLLRLIMALAVSFLALAVWRANRARASAEGRTAWEDRGHLLFLLAFALLGLSVVSWPVFYLLLQSYVSEWPGVMCVYGVTQIGSRSTGISGYLPALVGLAQALKPLVVFAGGAWFVLYLLNRHTQSAPLAGRALLLLIAVAMLAATDAGAETAYLLIPKKEQSLSAGCCTEAFDGAGRGSRYLPSVLIGESYRPWLYGAYFALNGGMALALAAALRFGGFRWLGLLAVLLALSLAGNALFLVEVAAPVLLHLPYHHCPYDLLPQVPESMVAVSLFLLGAFAVGWACVAACLGRYPETMTLLALLIRKLLNVGLFGYLGWFLMMSLELILA